MKTAIAVVVVSLITLSASAGIVETEPNNTFAQAQTVTPGNPPWADAGVFSLGGNGGDVDFITIQLEAGWILAVTTTPLDDGDPDTMMALYDEDMNELDFDDDDGPGLGSHITYFVETSGKYFIAVTGFNDRDFVGDHDETGRYILSIKVVPAPGALALLGLGAIAARRRRRD